MGADFFVLARCNDFPDAALAVDDLAAVSLALCVFLRLRAGLR